MKSNELNNSKQSFNFHFHPVLDENKIFLYCQGIPYTCGNYTKNKKGEVTKYSSYIFKEGHGTPIFFNEIQVRENDMNLLEADIKELLIINAVQMILTYHKDKPIKVAAGWIL